MVAKLQKALVDSPPLRMSEGGIFRPGFDPELDALTSLQQIAIPGSQITKSSSKKRRKSKLLKSATPERLATTSRSAEGRLDRIPGSFQRSQTLTNAERFITPELKEFEYKMLHAEEKISSLEHKLFDALTKRNCQFMPLMLRNRTGHRTDRLPPFACATAAHKYTTFAPCRHEQRHSTSLREGTPLSKPRFRIEDLHPQ